MPRLTKTERDGERNSRENFGVFDVFEKKGDRKTGKRKETKTREMRELFEHNTFSELIE